MLDGAVIVNVVEEVEPEAATLPDPVQPVQTYWVPEPPGVGEAMDPVIAVPESNQPLDGEGTPMIEMSVR
jgi:hypothetical protein